MKLTTILLGASAMLTATGAQAQTAGTYDFSYLFASTGNTVSGVLTGSLEADKNIFDITGVKSYAVNGEATMDMLNVGSSDQFYNTGNGPAIATLDGSKLNFYIDNSGPSDIFTTDVGNGVSNAAFGGNPVVGATINYGGGNFFDPYVQANYKASFVPAVTTGAGAVPEPATWAMMLVGFGMIGFGLRRRSKVSTTVRFA